VTNAAPEFETIDALGKTQQYGGSVGTTPIQVPAVAGQPLADVLIRCATDNSPITKRLLWSIDNVTYHTLAPGEFVGWDMRKDASNNEIKQIYLKGNVAAVTYEVIANSEEP
jgi:hypothetical protein